MGFMHEVAGTVTGSKNLIPLAGGGLAMAVPAAKTIKSIHWVPQEHVAIRLRHGKATRNGQIDGEMYSDLVEPGLRGSLLFWRSLHIVSLQDRTAEIQSLPIDSAEKLQLTIDASILWGVVREKKAALKAHFGTEGGINGTNERLRRVGRSCLRQSLAGRPLAEIQDEALVTERLGTALKEPFAACGVEFRGLMLEVATQTPQDRIAESLRQLHIPSAEQIAEQVMLHSEPGANPLRAVGGEGTGV